MLTLRGAAALLENAGSIDGLIAIARVAGCDGAPAPLDPDDRRALGLGFETVDVRIVPGAGALRALALTIRGETPLREILTRLSSRLARRAQHGLWLLVATRPAGSDVAVACWTSGGSAPRLAALVADRTRVVDSDADTLRALSGAPDADDLTTHARWVDALGREALSRRFFRELQRVIGGLADSATEGRDEARHEIALLHASRLLFLAFLEARGWLDGDPAFLSRLFDETMKSGGHFHRRALLPLFFGTLNTPVGRRAAAARRFGRVPFLNGGLFTPTPVERSHRSLRLGDAAFGALFGDVFARYRFTAREESTALEEAAIDPEMLGRTFESLMASGHRRATGAFYTPHPLVDRVTTLGIRAALAAPLGEHLAELVVDGAPLADDDRARARAVVEGLTVLDPACGSGAFLVHALDRIATLRRQLGDGRPAEALRRDTLTRSIFGVDVNPTAVWLCELRLWLTVVIESAESDPTRVLPLPNLDRNVRVGDSLAGPAFDTVRVSSGGPALRVLRRRYAGATGARKAALGRALDRAEREMAVRATDARLASIASHRRELLAARRARDLFGLRHVQSRAERERASWLRAEAATLRAARRRMLAGAALPFSFPAHFADIAARGGFGAVIGNPPWVRPHRLAGTVRESLRRDFAVARSAAWQDGADVSGAGSGFGAQIDIAALFVERSLRLLAPGAALALLVPAKLWRSLAGGGVRRLLVDDADLVHVEDYADAPAAFDASVYPGLVVARARRGRSGQDGGAPKPCVTASVAGPHRPGARWRIHPAMLAWDDSPGAPWLLLPAEVRRAFDTLREAGDALSESRLGRPILGVKCGYNDAFLAKARARVGREVDVIDTQGRTATLPSSMVRPALRGQAIASWRAEPGDDVIVWTHDASGLPLAELPPGAARWLGLHRRALMARTDLHGAQRWWSLFRTEAARSDKPRVVWSDIARTPRAATLAAHSPAVPLNSCYVVRCRDDIDAFAFAALLNSPLAAAWLDVLAEPARGGYRRFLGWTVALLPLPHDWDRSREILAAVGRRAVVEPVPPSRETLLDATLEAYGLPRSALAPLLAWGHR